MVLSFYLWQTNIIFDVRKKKEALLRPLLFVIQAITGIRRVSPVLMPVISVLMPSATVPMFELPKRFSQRFGVHAGRAEKFIG